MSAEHLMFRTNDGMRCFTNCPACAPCCDDGPTGHTQQQHHDASPCYDQACPFDHPSGGPFPHPCDWTHCATCGQEVRVDAPHKIGDCAAWVCFDCGWIAAPGSDGWHNCPGPVLTGGSAPIPPEVAGSNAKREPVE